MLISRRVAGARTTGDPAPCKTAATRPVFLAANRYNTPRRHPTDTHAREHDDCGSCSSRRRSHLLFASCPRETFTLYFQAVFVPRPPRTYVRRDTHPGTRFMNSTTVFFWRGSSFALLVVDDTMMHVGLQVNDPTICVVLANLLFFLY